MEQAQEIEPFCSKLLQSKETIAWKISNLSKVIETNSWPAMCITFDARGSLGRNYTWKISLFGDDDYLYGRAELIVPVKYRIPYTLKFYITNKPSDSSWVEEDDGRIREITNTSEPQKWKIIDKKYLTHLLKNPENALELRITVISYGSETSRGFQVQNYPF